MLNVNASSTTCLEWSVGAMVLGKLPVSGRPTIWMIVRQGPTALAVGANWLVWTFLLSSIFSLLFLPLSGRQPDADSQRAVKPKTTNQPTSRTSRDNLAYIHTQTWIVEM